jgi:hypothetical protein
MVLILLEIRERDLEYPALESVVCVLETGGAVDESFADTARLLVTIERCSTEAAVLLSDGEGGGSLDGVPVLLCEWVGALLEALLAL